MIGEIMENLMIVFGGKSVEHDISIITGVQISNACLELGYQIFPIYIDRSNQWYYISNLPKIENFKNLKDKKIFKKVFVISGDNGLYYKSHLGKIKRIANIDFALLCNHGNCGEDGCLPAVMKLCNIPYSSSDNGACAIAMDKCYMKDIFVANSISTLPYEKIIYDKNLINENYYEKLKEKLGNEFIIKPAHLGSSIGINIAKDYKSFEFAMQTAFEYDNKVLVETKLNDFIELNVAVRKNLEGEIVCSQCEYPKMSKNILSFDDKYMSKTKQGFSKNKFDSNFVHLLSNDLEEKAQELAIKTYKLFDAEGTVRIDFLYDKVDKVIYVNEINTIPGSLSLNLWLKSGFSNASVIRSLIKNGLKRYEKEKNIIKTFDSNVLNIY